MSAHEKAERREKELSRKAESRGRKIYVFSPSSPVLGSPGKLVSSSGCVEEQSDIQSKLIFPLDINSLSSENYDSLKLGESPEGCPEDKDNEGLDDESIEDFEEDFDNVECESDCSINCDEEDDNVGDLFMFSWGSNATHSSDASSSWKGNNLIEIYRFFFLFCLLMHGS